MRNVNPFDTEGASPFPTAPGRLSAEVEEIASVQVLFPDRRTLDEVIAELRDRIEKMETKEGV